MAEQSTEVVRNEELEKLVESCTDNELHDFWRRLEGTSGWWWEGLSSRSGY